MDVKKVKKKPNYWNSEATNVVCIVPGRGKKLVSVKTHETLVLDNIESSHESSSVQGI